VRHAQGHGDATHLPDAEQRLDEVDARRCEEGDALASREGLLAADALADCTRACQGHAPEHGVARGRKRAGSGLGAGSEQAGGERTPLSRSA